jgi:LytS/YehU family sensor histidine kinase
MEMRYSFQKKTDSLQAAHEKKALVAAAEISRQSTIKKSIALGSFLLFTSALVSFSFYKKRRDAKQKQQEAEFKTEVADTEMKALRAQMNPHFIFNSLNSISDYINKNDTSSADRYLGKFAKLMRMILENSEQKEVPLADDLKALELYMQLEALRLNNKFSYEIKVDASLDQAATLVPPLILQPFAENSIWHGIAKKEGPGRITIYIKREDDGMINCIIEDDGIGREQSAILKSAQGEKGNNSVAIKMTQARINIINKVKNSRAAVELFDLAQGLRVEVKLPLSTHF